jgi:serine/threonine protein kinase/HEAT repeat protein
MDRQRRLRIAALFEEAMDLPPEEQARFLDRECGGDVELRREVQKLLDADGTEPRQVGSPHPAPLPAERLTEVRSARRAGNAASSDAATPNDETSAPTMDAEPRQCAVSIGALIGRYRIVEQLGAGGMGAVFLARHEDLGHDAVVKVLLHRALASSADSAQRFLREARMAAAIRHPGVVQVMDVGRHESGDLFILMERLYGESLQRRLKRAGKLGPRTAISFAIQTARALEAVHAHGVHRDVKPDNLFLVPDPEVPGGERVKILDFGIAKLRSQDSELTHTHVAMGTPPYMAPEQCMGAADVDPRADLYSLGIILFQMLCGRLPFRCQSFGQYIIAHTQKKPPPVWRHARVSRELCDLVARLLAKRPDERFQSARALVEALEALPDLQEAPATASPSESEITTPRAVYEQAIRTEMTRLPAHVVTLPAVPSSRSGRQRADAFTGDRADAASAPPLDTEPQARAPETIEPTHAPECLAPGDTAPAVTVAPGIIADTASGITGAPGATADTAPGIVGAPGVTIDTLSMATIGSAERTDGVTKPWDLGLVTTLRWVYRHLPAVGVAILAVTVSAVALRAASQSSQPTPGSTEDVPVDAGPSPDAAMLAASAEAMGRAGALRKDLDVLFDGNDEGVQREIIRAIVDVGTSEGVWLLNRALAKGRPAIRLEASHAMCSLGWPDRAARLREAMGQSGSALRVQFAVALVCLGDREGISVLEKALDAQGLLRIQAAEALARAGEREPALPVLERELAGAVPGSAPWLHAARGLMSLKHAGAREKLMGELARPEPDRALAAAGILAEKDDREALAYLERVLADAASAGRVEAAWHLARHARDDAGVASRVIAFAEAALASPDAHERRAAAALLGRLAEYGRERFVPALEALIDTDDGRDPEERAVRITARIALLAVYRASESRNPL